MTLLYDQRPVCEQLKSKKESVLCYSLVRVELREMRAGIKARQNP